MDAFSEIKMGDLSFGKRELYDQQEKKNSVLFINGNYSMLVCCVTAFWNE